MDDVIRESQNRIIPLSVTWELTTKCNHRCRHCYIPKHAQTGMPLNQIFRILEDLRASGTFNLTLTGGEIFTRHDIMEIISQSRLLGFSTTLFTNATLITAELAQQISSLYVHEVDVSVYSTNASTHDKITRTSGSLSDTLHGIDLLMSSGVKVVLKCPVMSINFSDYPSVIDLADKLGVQIRLSPQISIKNDGDISPISLRLTNEQLEEFVKDPRTLNRSLTDQRASELSDIVPCTAIFNNGAIDCDGNVYPCNQWLDSLGNLSDNSFIDIWLNSSKAKSMREIRVRDLKECGECELFSYCTRCPGVAWLEDGNHLGCSVSAKQLAEARAKCNIFPEPSEIFSPLTNLI